MKIIFLFLLAVSTAVSGEEAIAAENDIWTFDHPQNTACITVTQIIMGHSPILSVSHDGDHGWQFLTGKPVSMSDALVVGIGEIVKIDPTVLEIGTIPPGYYATRKSIASTWVIQKRKAE